MFTVLSLLFFLVFRLHGAMHGIDFFRFSKNSISEWALQEAKERMEARGEPTQYRP
jgi:hypothetical protein